ncbi:MAG: molybdate ABC transporter substrate-binding protein [Lachnospiraceae bacterium]|nr:molybdate ABC transporter substrate-binding protein [Lachnospiraceae bacterium]
MSKCEFIKKNVSKKYVAVLSAVVLSVGMLVGCGETEQGSAPTQSGEVSEKTVELTILAAASLTDVCGEIETKYEEENPGVDLIFSFGGSGALQAQIEEGAPADVFISASNKQMNALNDLGLMDSESIVQLLENKVVLVVPVKDGTTETAEKNGMMASAEVQAVTTFEDVATDKVTMIGLGEPGSVPVGQYAEEIFTTLGILEAVKAKANYGSDVRTVLSWVETGAVDCGVVYATDAYTTDMVKIVCEAPEGSCKQVIYPAGVVKASENAAAAEAFVAYLQTDEIMDLFESYGFSKAD